MLQPLCDKLKIGTFKEWFDKCNSKGVFKAGPEKGNNVTWGVMTLIAKFLLLNPKVFAGECAAKCTEAECPCMSGAKCYGRAKYFALKGDGKAVRKVLTACNGSAANIAKLTDTDLVELWALNEHIDIHCCGMGKSEFFHAAHCTSLNDCGDPAACPKDKPPVDGVGNAYVGGRGDDHWGTHGPVGGFNDKGNYEQWPWYYYAQKTLSFFDVPDPPT